jgi:hypothetical protein
VRSFTRTSGINCKTKKIIGVKQESGHYETIRIHSKNNRSLWQNFLEYINSIEIDKIFTRFDLLENTYEKNVVPALRANVQTVDTYRRYIEKLGYIDHVGIGKYIKKHNIPINVKLNLVISLAFNKHSWQKWFIPNDQKRRKIEQICNK